MRRQALADLNVGNCPASVPQGSIRGLLGPKEPRVVLHRRISPSGFSDLANILTLDVIKATNAITMASLKLAEPPSDQKENVIYRSC